MEETMPVDNIGDEAGSACRDHKPPRQDSGDGAATG
jgi:hypothetical protein